MNSSNTSDLYISECLPDENINAINQKWEWEPKTNRIISKNKEGNSQFASDFLSKYSRTLGGANSAEDKGLIEEDRIVRPENLAQLSAQPAAGGNAIQDPNVAGKFPSQEVNV